MLSLKGYKFILNMTIEIFVFDEKSIAVHFEEIEDFSDCIVYGYFSQQKYMQIHMY